MADRQFGKDFFSWIRLPVARRYVRAGGRGRLFAIGALASLVAAGVFAADAFLGNAGAVSRGALSDSHALFAEDCSTCHTPFEGALDRKCSVCHERGDQRLGEYTWDRHYVYRSDDFDRSAAASLETSCAACHVEHQGREASLQNVSDGTCRTCHDFGGFDEGHPQFAFAAEGMVDDANLSFNHVMHVAEVMDVEEIAVIENACLSCHVPSQDGRSFQPISFERSCDDCHMGRESSPRLPIAEGDAPGVRTLAQIRASGEPGTQWAHYWDPTEFSVLGNTVQKRPLYHPDPWVMENLRLLRRRLYPGAELADLLQASGDLPPNTSPRVLYEEALATLEERIRALSGEPSRDVQRELEELRALLGQVRQRLEDPYATLDDSRFLVGVADRAPGTATGEIDQAAYEAVIADLTEECRACHVVERATIGRVQTDQRALVRAEFDHRSHVLHAGCLDCHTAIPVREYLDDPDAVPPEIDRAVVQNIPGIESCRSCHSEDGPQDSCTTCHVFHPDLDRRSRLSRVGR